MIIILTVSSGTFAFRAITEILFLFDVSVLDFEYVLCVEVISLICIIPLARSFSHLHNLFMYLHLVKLLKEICMWLGLIYMLRRISEIRKEFADSIELCTSSFIISSLKSARWRFFSFLRTFVLPKHHTPVGSMQRLIHLHRHLIPFNHCLNHLVREIVFSDLVRLVPKMTSYGKE